MTSPVTTSAFSCYAEVILRRVCPDAKLNCSQPRKRLHSRLWDADKCSEVSNFAFDGCNDTEPEILRDMDGFM